MTDTGPDMCAGPGSCAQERHNHTSGAAKVSSRDFRLVVRSAAKRDIPGLLELEDACFEAYHLKERSFRRLMQSGSAEVYAGLIGGYLCASSVILRRKNSEGARIYSLAVHPQWQKKGIGRMMIEFIEDRARKEGRKWVSLEVDAGNEAARALYSRMGYAIAARIEGYYPNGSDALRLRKYLR